MVEQWNQLTIEGRIKLFIQIDRQIEKRPKSGWENGKQKRKIMFGHLLKSKNSEVNEWKKFWKIYFNSWILVTVYSKVTGSIIQNL